jgi:acetyl esterase/lipase
VDLLDRLDPDVAEVVRVLPPLDLHDIPTARRVMLQMLAAIDPPAQRPCVNKEDHFAPGPRGAPEVRVRLYRPTGALGVLPCLYWIHGGGYVLGEMEQDDALMENMVATLGCAAVSVEWRLAPENPYPAPMEDCYAGLTWTAKNAARFDIDPGRIAVAGASSGGGSAAGLALLARDRGQVKVGYQLLIYPMLDDRNLTPSSKAITDARVWNRESNLIGWRSYLGDRAGGRDVPSYAAPSRATNLNDLPPTFIAVGELDLFLDEDIDYAQRLLQARVPTELHVYAGAPHGFDRLAPNAAVSQRSERDRVEALGRAFQPDR